MVAFISPADEPHGTDIAHISPVYGAYMPFLSLNDDVMGSKASISPADDLRVETAYIKQWDDNSQGDHPSPR